MITIDTNPNVTFTDDEIRQMLKEPKNSVFWDSRDPVLGAVLFKTWALGDAYVSGHSDLRTESNAAAFIKMLESREDIKGKWKVARYSTSNGKFDWVDHLAYEVLELIPRLDDLDFNISEAEANVRDIEAGGSLDPQILRDGIVTMKEHRQRLAEELGELPGFQRHKLSLVAKVVKAWDTIVNDSSVADEDDLENRRYAQGLRSVEENGYEFINEDCEITKDGSKEWIEAVYEWICEHDNALIDRDGTDDGPWILGDEMIPAMIALGIIKPEIEAKFYKVQLEIVYQLRRMGIQTKSSLQKLLTFVGDDIGIDFLRVCLDALINREMITEAEGCQITINRFGKNEHGPFYVSR